MPTKFHIAYACNEAYAPYVAVSLLSLVESQPNVPDTVWKIHVLTDGLSTKQQQRLKETHASRQDFELVIHHVEKSLIDGLPQERFTHITYYRLILPQLLQDAKRVLYIDTDCLILRDLSPLFTMPLHNTVAAVGKYDAKADIKRLGLPKDAFYFYAAPLLINIAKWNIQDATSKAFEWLHKHKGILKFPDMDALNALFHDDCTALPMHYNVVPEFTTNKELFKDKRYKDDLYQCLFEPSVVHYASCAPWYKDEERSPFQSLWLATNKRLSHPAKLTYRAKGWLRFKIWLKQLIMPSSKPQQRTIEEMHEHFRQAAL